VSGSAILGYVSFCRTVGAVIVESVAVISVMLYSAVLPVRLKTRPLPLADIVAHSVTYTR
jgi:hypothetical protein